MGAYLTPAEQNAIRQRAVVSPDADQACKDRAALLAYADYLWGAVIEIGTNTYKMVGCLQQQVALLQPLVEILALSQPDLPIGWLHEEARRVLTGLDELRASLDEPRNKEQSNG